MIQIYCSHVTKIQWSDIQTQISILHETDQEMIRQYKFDKDKCRALLGKMLLLYTIKKQEAYHLNRLPQLSYSPYKKPFIASMHGHFNISHAGDWVICAYSQQGEIGIDIEKESCIDIRDYKAVLTPSEYQRAHNQSDFDFFQLWTLKEAIMKAEGLGFYLSPTSFEIPHPFVNNTHVQINRRWFLYSQHFKQCYRLSLAAPFIITTPLDISTLSIHDLLA